MMITKQLTVMLRQLAALLQAKITLMSALTTLIEINHQFVVIQKLLIAIKNDVAAGLSFSQALLKHPRYFSAQTCQFIYAGEQTAMLALVVDQVASYQENMGLLKKRIQSALFYPAMVLILSVVIVIGLMLFIVPQFEQLFASFGATLPWLTLVVLNGATCLENHGLKFLAVFLVFIITLIILKNYNVVVARTFSWWSLKLPIFGQLRQQMITAKAARTLAMACQAGLTVVEALKITAKTITQYHYQCALAQISQSVMKGDTLAQAIQHTQLFSPLMVQMVGVGEQAGTLNVMLIKVAEWNEIQIDQMIANLNHLLEPALMIFLGLFVGGLVIAMYLPVFQLGKVI